MTVMTKPLVAAPRAQVVLTNPHEDCLPHDAAAVHIEPYLDRTWVLTDGRSRIASFENRLDAKNGLSAALGHTVCWFIGRRAELPPVARSEDEETRTPHCDASRAVFFQGRKMVSITRADARAYIVRRQGEGAKTRRSTESWVYSSRCSRTAVRNLERAGVPRSQAMKPVGHKTEAIYRRYAIVSAADLDVASERLATMFAVNNGVNNGQKSGNL